MKSQSRQRDRFPAQVAKPLKRAAGATNVGMTPLNVRVGKRVTLDGQTREHIERRMARQLAKFAVLIQGSTVRFDDVNGKRGGVDASCSIKVVLTARPDVVVEERAATPREAFDAAAGAAERAVRRSLGRAEMHARPPRRGRTSTARAEEPGAVPSAAPPKQPSGSTARRNIKLNVAGMTSALEDSAQSTPSRKSTRRSIDGAKRDTNLALREVRKLHSAKARARRDLSH